MLRTRVLGRSEQLAIAHAAQLPVPLAVALDAQSELVELLRPGEAGFAGHRCDVSRRRRRCLHRQYDRDAEFLGRKLAVEVKLQRDPGKMVLRLGRASFGLECAAVPVGPGRVGAQRRRHAIDGGLDRTPLAGAQRGARLPLEHFVDPRCVWSDADVLAAAPVPLVRLGQQPQRAGVADAAPDDAALLRSQVQVQRVRVFGRVARTVARQPHDRDDREFALNL